MGQDKSVNSIQDTLLKLARPGMRPKELLRLTRHAHPDASKKAIVRAAFGSIIAIADSDLEKALILQDFALKARPGEDH